VWNENSFDMKSWLGLAWQAGWWVKEKKNKMVGETTPSLATITGWPGVVIPPAQSSVWCRFPLVVLEEIVSFMKKKERENVLDCTENISKQEERERKRLHWKVKTILTYQKTTCCYRQPFTRSSGWKRWKATVEGPKKKRMVKKTLQKTNRISLPAS
jgi:hypothetical protein